MAADQIKRSRRDSSPGCKLPVDVLVSILIKLPIKQLMRFQAVSNYWCSLISSTHFFKTHLHRQSVVAPNHCLLSLRNDSGYVDEDEDEGVDLQVGLLDEEEDEGVDLQVGVLDLTHHYDSPAGASADNDVLMLSDDFTHGYNLPLLDSCSGLLCFGGFFKTPDDVILWNPATRRHRALDLPEGDGLKLDFPTLGLCYVDAIDDFKILVWNYRYPGFTVDAPCLYVYSLTSDSWDKFEFYAPETEIEFKSPTFMGRSMHWLSHTCPKGSKCKCSSATEIVAFDVMNRTKSCFRLPDSCGRHPLTKLQTLVIGGCLSVVIYYDTDGAQEYGIGIWVMEEYGVEGSWVKRFFIQEEEFEQVKFPIVSWNNGEIVFNNDGDDSRVLIFYDPYSRKKRHVRFSSYHVKKFFKYVESLASVKPVEDGLDSSGEEGKNLDDSS